MAYIDKEKLIKDIESKRLVIQDGTSAAEAIRIQGKAIRRAIEEAPTADVVEIPCRCGECRFNVANMEKDGLDITDYSGTDIVCSYHMSDGFEPTDFCSYGDRRDDK